MLCNRAMLVSALLLLLCAPAGFAQSEDWDSGEDEDAKQSVSFGVTLESLSLDMASTYYYRGILQEDSGLIFQPAASASLYFSGADWLSSLSFGVWNSFHSERTGFTGSPSLETWYEMDAWATLSLSPSERWKFDTTFTHYRSPNHGFRTVDEFAFDVYFDDSDLWVWDAFALKPYVSLAVEIDGTAFGSDEGTYLEIGMAPGIPVSEDSLVSFTLPSRLGFGLDRYYESAAHGDQAFGFASVALAAES